MMSKVGDDQEKNIANCYRRINTSCYSSIKKYVWLVTSDSTAITFFKEWRFKGYSKRFIPENDFFTHFLLFRKEERGYHG